MANRLMKIALPQRYRALLGGVGVIGVATMSTIVSTMTTPTASAAPGDCTASELARMVSAVTNNVADYLDAHPDANDAFTALKGLPRAQMRAQAQVYLAANPAEKADLQAIRQPLKDMTQRCGTAIGPLS